MAENSKNDAAKLEEFRKNKIDHIESDSDRKLCEAAYLSSQKTLDSFKDQPDEDDDVSIEDIYKATLHIHLKSAASDSLSLDVEIDTKYLDVPLDMKKNLYGLVIENVTRRFCSNLVKDQSTISYVVTTSTNRKFSTEPKKCDQWAWPVIMMNLLDKEENYTADLTGKSKNDAAKLEEFRKNKIDHIESDSDRKLCEAAYLSSQKTLDSFKDQPDEDDDVSIEDIYKATLHIHLKSAASDSLSLDVEIDTKYLDVPLDMKKNLYGLVIENVTRRFCSNLVKDQSTISYVVTTSTNRKFSTEPKKCDQWAWPVIMMNLLDKEENYTADLTGKFGIDLQVVHDKAALEQMTANMIAGARRL